MPQQDHLRVGVGGLLHYPIFSGNIIMYNGIFCCMNSLWKFWMFGIFIYKANVHCLASTTMTCNYVCSVFYELLRFQKAHVFLYIQLCILRKNIKIPSDFGPKWNLEYLTNDRTIFNCAVYILWEQILDCCAEYNV